MSSPQSVAVEAGTKTRVTGLVPPIVTPFRDGALDLDSLKRVLDDLAEHVSGILVGGSVGETPSLTVDERLELMHAVARHLSGRSLFLAVSIADNSIVNSRRLAEAAGEVGADVCVLSCPNYFTNDRGMLEAYFAAISEFTPADLCLYDNPLATQTILSVEDIKALITAAPRLTHVKVTDTALGKVDALRRETDLVVLSGDDVVLWHQLSRGAEGAMVALPMIDPLRASAIWRALARGDTDAAYEEYRHVTTLIHIALGAPDYVPVIKTVLHARGVIASPEVRLPLVELATVRRDEVLACL
jgi:4-hydroxy-tetrahydrodipicolinate synthase